MKLHDLRNALAKASLPKAGPSPKVDLASVLAVIAQIEKIARKAPAQAREVLAGVIGPAVLTPGPNGYEIALTLRNETAAIAGGRTLLSESCRGLLMQFDGLARRYGKSCR